MKTLYKSLILMPLALVIGYIAANITLKQRVDSRIEEIIGEFYEKEAKKFRSEFVLIGPDYEVPDSFSVNETFQPAHPETLDNYLLSKVGFKMEIQNLKFVERGTDMPNLGMFYDKYGTDYTFEVNNFSEDNAIEKLIIGHYEKNLTSVVLITDENHDEIPDRICVFDYVNNTDITITRNRDGILEYENINEEGAKRLFDMYTYEYQTFKKEFRVDERIFEYEPKLEINQIDPNHPGIPGGIY
ncbi:hypothetical protein HQ533_05880 [Candidatus Woesearchaeota archaeon]|nr:hypothetical protein [Candidatus Woesearchaeota archaeon]